MENKIEKWSYKVPSPIPIFDNQKDWNQTLITKFNELLVGTRGEIIIKVPNKFKHLIESLFYYDSINFRIGTRFIIEFFESENNIIYVGYHELEIEDFSN